jgi:hypothetical protein
MPSDGAGGIHALRLRVAKLDASGAPLVGATNMFVSDALVSLAIDPQYEEGEEQTVRNGSGLVCLTYKAPDSLKRANLTLTICRPDPGLTEFLAGGSTIVSGSDTIGHAAPPVGADPTPNGVSLEAWSRAILSGGGAATPPYRWWTLGRTKWRIDASTLDANPQTPTFTGYGEENPNYGNGPNNDWTYTSGRVWAWVRSAVIPVSGLDPVAVPVQT